MSKLNKTRNHKSKQKHERKRRFYFGERRRVNLIWQNARTDVRGRTYTLCSPWVGVCVRSFQTKVNIFSSFWRWWHQFNLWSFPNILLDSDAEVYIYAVIIVYDDLINHPRNNGCFVSNTVASNISTHYWIVLIFRDMNLFQHRNILDIFSDSPSPDQGLFKLAYRFGWVDIWYTYYQL